MTTTAATAMSRVRLTVGITAIFVGLVTFWLSRLVESGFVHGFFQGSTLALMVAGAYLVGAAMWRRGGRAEIPDDRHWLPSRDGAGEATGGGGREAR